MDKKRSDQGSVVCVPVSPNKYNKDPRIETTPYVTSDHPLFAGMKVYLPDPNLFTNT